jgi:phosphatidylglycerophosphate synthase
MSKLSKTDKFLDFSDYGRSLAKPIAIYFSKTRFNAVHVTWLFVLSAFISLYSIYMEYYITAAVFLLLKSVLDAADGELARLKKMPSYTGRYLDSVWDIVLNFLFLMLIAHVTNQNYSMAFIAFLLFQLQGTVYNYYYVILRNQKLNADKTSRVFENKTPVAFPYESQFNVTLLFSLYKAFYGVFDFIIYQLEKSASKVKNMPKWFMSFVSIYGLGFQLLIIALFLSLNLKAYIILFFIVYSLFIPLFIGLRKMFVR